MKAAIMKKDSIITTYRDHCIFLDFFEFMGLKFCKICLGCWDFLGLWVAENCLEFFGLFMCWCVVIFWVYLFLFLSLLLKSKIMMCVNYWWIRFVFDGKTKWKEKMVKIPVEVGETFNAYLNLIFFELLLVY